MFKKIITIMLLALSLAAQTGIQLDQLKSEPVPYEITTGTKSAFLVIGGKLYQVNLGSSFKFTLENGVVTVNAPTIAPPPMEFKKFIKIITGTTQIDLQSLNVDPLSVRYYRNGLMQSEEDFTFDPVTGIITLKPLSEAAPGDSVLVFWRESGK